MGALLITAAWGWKGALVPVGDLGVRIELARPGS